MERLLLVAILAGLVMIYRKQKLLNRKINYMAKTQQEAAAQLEAQAVKLEKIQTEVQSLKDAYANSGQVIPELEAAIDRVDSLLTAVDDINEDAATEEPA